MKKKLIIPLIILLVLTVTFVGSVAFFSLAKIGNTESSIQIGELTFKYTETSGKGHGINLADAYPMSDTEGKASTEYFDFKVEANLTRSDLAYQVELDTTLSDLPDNGIKVYLTEIVDGNEVEINSIVNTISSYQTSDNGRIIYSETIPRNTKNYVKNFRLRLWIDESIDWTDDLYMGHSGTFTVNVKANSDSSMAATDTVTDKTASVDRVVANNKYLFTESQDTGVDYEVTVPYTVNNIDIEVYESNTQATSTVTPLNSLSGVSSKVISQNIHTGNNYFKITTTASNGITQEEHILKVVKEADTNNDLLNLGVEGYSLTPVFDKDTTNYTLILEEPSITITGNKASDTASITGLGEKTLVFGDNTFDITVTSESGVDKTYTITVTNTRPTAPTITGNSRETPNPVTITFATPAFAISGIDHYDVYVANDSTEPTDNTVATTTTTGNYTISTVGTYYIYYRTVSNKGLKSEWSNAQVVHILEPGLYDSNGNLTKTWAQLESLGLTKANIETDYTDTAYNTTEGAPNKILNDNNLTGKLVFPNTITTVGKNAFRNTGLTAVVFSNSIEEVKYYSFRDNSNLTSINLSEGLTTIGRAAFENASLVTELYIPASVAVIEPWAIGGTSIETLVVDANNPVLDSRNNSNAVIETATNTLVVGCKTTVIPNGILTLGEASFAEAGLESITIPNSVKTIGAYSLARNTSLESITIPDSVTSIGGYAFQGDTSLVSVTIPNSVLMLGKGAFYGAGLTTVTLPNNLRTIGDYTFYNTPLSSITIPDSVTSIGQNAFLGNTSLVSLTLGKNVKTIGYAAFYNTGLTSITIPDGVTTIGDYAFANSANLTSVTLGKNVQTIGQYAFRYVPITSITIPNSVTTIKQGAFYGITSLKSLTLGSNVRVIDNYAFNKTSLTSLTIPDSVTTIGESAFREIETLTSLTLGSRVEDIGYAAFYKVPITTLIIPSSVTHIDAYAFDHTNLTSATFNNPNGWYIVGQEGTTLSLTNTSTNATYLKSTYYNKEWKKN